MLEWMFIWRGFIWSCSGQNVHLLTSVSPLFYHTTSQVVIDEKDTNTTLTSHRLTPDLPSHGPLARYVKLRVAHVPGMPGTFSPPAIAVSFEVGGRENVHGIPGTCATHNFTYLARDPPPPTTPKQNTPSTMRTWVLTYSSRLLGQNCS